jgi:hypothetical protein
VVVLFLFDADIYIRRWHLAESERVDAKSGDALSNASKLSKTCQTTTSAERDV